MAGRHDDLNVRTKKFAVAAALLAQQLEQSTTLRSFALQLARAASSVGANQRAARRARSTRELAAKLSTIVEEVDEAVYWCELLLELNVPNETDRTAQSVCAEAKELRAIYATGRATVRRKLTGRRADRPT
jgi:four helix bundle protein